MNLIEPPKELSVSKIVAAMIYFIFGVIIYIPIAYLMAKVDLNLTLVIFIMLFVINLCKMYLGIK